jgi:hypothetical protein
MQSFISDFAQCLSILSKAASIAILERGTGFEPATITLEE